MSSDLNRSPLPQQQGIPDLLASSSGFALRTTQPPTQFAEATLDLLPQGIILHEIVVQVYGGTSSREREEAALLAARVSVGDPTVNPNQAFRFDWDIRDGILAPETVEAINNALGSVQIEPPHAEAEEGRVVAGRRRRFWRLRRMFAQFFWRFM